MEPKVLQLNRLLQGLSSCARAASTDAPCRAITLRRQTSITLTDSTGAAVGPSTPVCPGATYNLQASHAFAVQCMQHGSACMFMQALVFASEQPWQSFAGRLSVSNLASCSDSSEHNFPC